MLRQAKLRAIGETVWLFKSSVTLWLCKNVDKYFNSFCPFCNAILPFAIQNGNDHIKMTTTSDEKTSQWSTHASVKKISTVVKLCSWRKLSCRAMSSLTSVLFSCKTDKSCEFRPWKTAGRQSDVTESESRVHVSACAILVRVSLTKEIAHK